MRVRLGLIVLLIFSVGCVLYSLNEGRRERERYVEDLNSGLHDSQLVTVGLLSRTVAIVTPPGWEDRPSCTGWVGAILHEKDEEPVRRVLKQHGFVEVQCGQVKGDL
jgi:hypothetical protein